MAGDRRTRHQPCSFNKAVIKTHCLLELGNMAVARWTIDLCVIVSFVAPRQSMIGLFIVSVTNLERKFHRSVIKFGANGPERRCVCSTGTHEDSSCIKFQTFLVFPLINYYLTRPPKTVCQRSSATYFSAV